MSVNMRGGRSQRRTGTGARASFPRTQRHTEKRVTAEIVYFASCEERKGTVPSICKRLHTTRDRSACNTTSDFKFRQNGGEEKERTTSLTERVAAENE